MSRSTRRLAVVGVAVVAVVAVAAGVLALGVSVDGGPPDPGALQDRIEEANRSIDAYEATVRSTVDTGNETREVVYRVAVDRPDRLKITYRAPENLTGDVILSNRSGTYNYDRSRGRITRLGMNDTPVTDPVESLVAAVTDDESTFEGEDRIEGSSGVVLQYSAGEADVGLRVGGSAPAARFSSSDDAERLDLSVWIDPERDLPVRFRQRIALGNRTTVVTTRITNLTRDPGFGDGRFRLDPARETTVVERNVTTERFDSRAAMAANVSMSVPDPTVPGGYSLESAAWARVDGNRSVALSYRDGRTPLIVVKRRPAAEMPDAANSTRVDLGDVRGYYVTGPTGSFVAWTCDGASYQVSGVVEKGVLVEVAQSVGCG